MEFVWNLEFSSFETYDGADGSTSVGNPVRLYMRLRVGAAAPACMISILTRNPFQLPELGA
jgi:hypothetical protein